MRQRLNPADHFTLMLDHEIRCSGLAGNLCILAYELDGIPDVHELAVRASRFVARCPQAGARLCRQRRRYYWEWEAGAPIFFHHRVVDVHAAVCELINRKEAPENIAPLEIHLIEAADGATLLLRWFHPICDAKGAELILHHLLSDETPSADGTREPLATLINSWSLWRKIGLAWKANRHVVALDRHVSVLPRQTEGAAARLDFCIVRHSADESTTIMRHAMKQTGMTGTALYFIGCLMRAVDAAGGSHGDSYCVPYAMNLRKRRALYPLFGNQVTFLFAQASRDEASDRTRLFAALREQHKQTVRGGLDRALIPLMQAGSWLSLETFGGIRNTRYKSERCSFWFSYTGEPEPRIDAIDGIPVKGMFQLSQVTAPPSLGLLVSHYAGRITLSYNYIPTAIDEGWMQQLIASMRAELLTTT
jgi:hypothetical protein